MKIYKNFLHSSDFEHIRNEIYSKTFPWYFNDSIVGYTGARYDFQFIHNFYNHGAPRSPYFEMIKPILVKINPYVLIKAKVNLLPQTEKPRESFMHIDNPNAPRGLKIYTGIYYLDTNNGYTKFSNGKKVGSEENKFVEFDYKMQHTGANCSDKYRRVVINLNYVKL
tara:strand:+ start:1142 stop:1642 length:501 start_codon:yes stop_codon:yes gene_type:complete